MQKQKLTNRLVGWGVVWLVACTLWWWSGEPTATASSDQWTVPPVPPILTNGSFECANGFTINQNPAGIDVWIPNGWSVIYVFGRPELLSSRISRFGECQPNGQEVSKMDGQDAWFLSSEDIATPPVPGKPFDLVLYQRIPATYGGAYSVSGWMASECGDNRNGPNPCPDEYYIAKMIGIDPWGGTDPLSPEIEWMMNTTDRRWHGLYASTTALTDTITVFTRAVSPFQFQNNKAFVDAVSLVRAPLSAMHPLSTTVTTGEVELRWFGEQSEDIDALPGGNYDLLFDVQTRPLPGGEWRNVVTGTTAQGSFLFQAPCPDIRYQFRVRARAEQPEGEPGLFPNHRYPGVWTKPQTVSFVLLSEPVVDTSPISPTLPITITPPLTVTLPITTTPEITSTLEISPTLYFPLTARRTLRDC